VRPSAGPYIELQRLEEACRQTQRQLDIIKRRIARGIPAMDEWPLYGVIGYRGAPKRRPSRSSRRYRRTNSAFAAKQLIEIEALLRRLARQEQEMRALERV